MTDVSDLVGAPFKYGSRGEDGYYDCFGFLYEYYRRAGKPLPSYQSSKSQSENARNIFSALRDICRPCDLKRDAILVFRIKRHESHLAVYLGDDEFIHAWEGADMVVVERLSGVWEKRLVGVYEPK